MKCANVGAVLAELHLHLYGCIRARDLLDYLVTRDRIAWDWYETEMEAAFGSIPATRVVVDRYRGGDASAAAEFEKLFVFGDTDAGNFDRFQAKYNLLVAGSALQDADARAELEAEIAGFAARIRADHHRNQIAHAEQRLLLNSDLDTARDRLVLETLLRTYAGHPDGTTERLNISLPRTDPWLGWERVQELALGPYGQALTGVDFCGFEEGHPPREKSAFFAAVRQFNAAHPERALAILYHVGESFRDKSLESAVRWVQEAAELGAHRLGHAIALGIDPDVFGPHTRTEPVSERRDQITYDLEHAAGLREAGVDVEPAALRSELAELARLPADRLLTLDYDRTRLDEVRARQSYAMDRVRRTGAVIEVCPTSNRRIGSIADPEHHPVQRFVAAELPLVVSSDNPGIFATTLHDELTWVCTHTGRGEELRQRLIRTAWNARSEVLSGRVAAESPS